MSNMSKKLVLSILAVVLTVVALGTTTFAWFTLTNVAEVQSFQADVTAGEGIEISLDGSNWYTTITTELIEDYLFNPASAGYLGANWTFNDVTTSDAETFTNIAGNAPRFIEFPLYFRSENVDEITWTGVSLTTLNPQTFNVDVPEFSYKGTDYELGDDILNVDVSDAARIAILDENGATTSTVAFEKAAAGTNTVLGTGGDLSDFVALDDDNEGKEGSVNYYYLKNDALPTGADNVVTIDTITDLDADPVVLDLDGTSGGYSYTGNMVVRIWIEGWDAEMFNAIFDGTLVISLEFTGVPAA